MAKSKKKRQPDFQKVKLKVGKKLPRGLNETVASFKTKSIQIKEQLKQSTSEQPKTRRNLNINDVLCQTQHYNASVRLDALTGLRELLTQNAGLHDSHLAHILEKVSPLVVDKESTVRTGLIKFFKVLFPLVTSSNVAPFFSSLTAHVCCAMTHINDQIKIDSLEVMDLLLDSYPELVTCHTGTILPNFLEQISHKNSKKAGKDGDGRSLLVNPDSVLSTRKGKLKVLKRLHTYLQALKTQTQKNTLSEKVNRQHMIGADTMKHVVILPSNIAILLDARNAFTFSAASSRGLGFDSTAWLTVVTDHAPGLVSLLFQCWAEVAPDLNKQVSALLLSLEMVPVLEQVLSVLLLLLQLLSHNRDNQPTKFLHSVREQLTRHILPCFPFQGVSVDPMLTKFKGKLPKQITPVKVAVPEVPNTALLESLNLTCCQVLSFVMDIPENDLEGSESSGMTFTKKDKVKLQSRVMDVFTNDRLTQLDRSKVKAVIAITAQILANRNPLDEQCELLCDYVFRLYKDRLSRHASDLQLFLPFFADLAFKSKPAVSTQPSKLRAVVQWMVSLPKVCVALLKHSNFTKLNESGLMDRLLHCLSQAGARAHAKFVDNLTQMFFDTLLKPPNLPLLLKLSLAEVRSLLQLLHWLPGLNEDHVVQVAQVCRMAGPILGTANRSANLDSGSSGSCDLSRNQLAGVTVTTLLEAVSESRNQLAGVTVTTLLEAVSAHLSRHAMDLQVQLDQEVEEIGVFGREGAKTDSAMDLMKSMCKQTCSFLLSTALGPLRKMTADSVCVLSGHQVALDSWRQPLHRFKLAQASGDTLVCSPVAGRLEAIVTAYLLRIWDSPDVLPVIHTVCGLKLILACLKAYELGSKCAVLSVEQHTQLQNNIRSSWRHLDVTVSRVVISVAAILVTVGDNIEPHCTGQKPGGEAKGKKRKCGEEVDSSASKAKKRKWDGEGNEQVEIENEAAHNAAICRQGLETCRACVEMIPGLGTAIVNTLTSRIPDLHDPDDIRLAVRVITELVLPSGCEIDRKQVANKMASFIDTVNGKYQLTQAQWFNDFAYKVKVMNIGAAN